MKRFARQLLDLHRWFVRESRGYVGPYTWKTRLEFPRAWLRFMFFSLRDYHRRGLLILLVLALPSVVQAQTITQSATWTQTEPPAQAQTIQYFLGSSLTPLTVKLPATCTASGSGSSCTAPIPAKFSDGTTVLVKATFTLYAQAANGQGPAGTSGPLAYDPAVTVGPSNPGGFTINIIQVFKQ